MTNDSKHDLQALGIVFAKLLHAQCGNVADAAISLGVSTASLRVLHEIKSAGNGCAWFQYFM